MRNDRYTGEPKEKYVRKSLKLPEIINEDLTYYMQFGFKKVIITENIKYQENKHSRTAYSAADYYA
tara:strand:+ start:4070 stop:4267 length:198 start_codon:yes stop_codon:yes gene_type:complete